MPLWFVLRSRDAGPTQHSTLVPTSQETAATQNGDPPLRALIPIQLSCILFNDSFPHKYIFKSASCTSELLILVFFEYQKKLTFTD